MKASFFDTLFRFLNCLCFDTLSRPSRNEVFSELGTSNYYADEMSRGSIEEFKKILSNSSDVKLDFFERSK